MERERLFSPLFFTGEAFRIFAERLSAQSYPTERSNAVTKLIRRRYRAPPAISPRALKLRVKGTLLSSSPLSSSLACVPRIALAERECEPSPRGGRVREGGKRARARRTRVVSGFEIATGLTRKQALCDLFRGYVPRLENCQPFFFPLSFLFSPPFGCLVAKYVSKIHGKKAITRPRASLRAFIIFPSPLPSP